MNKLSICSKKTFFGFAIIVFLYALPNIGFAQNDGSSKTYTSDYSEVWKNVIRAMIEGGHSIQNQDKETGTVSMEWTLIKESGLFARGWRAKQNILVDKLSDSETKVTLKLIFQNKMDKAQWRPASNDNTYTPKIFKWFFDYLDQKLNN